MRHVIMLALTVSLVACGSSADPGHQDGGSNSVQDGGPLTPDGGREDAGVSDGGGPIDPNDWSASAYCAQVDRLSCEHQGFCGHLGDDTVESCTAAAVADCTADFQPALEAIAAGRLTYDEAKARACYAAHQDPTRPCASGFPETYTEVVQFKADPDCHFLTGAVPLGGQCFDSGYNECAEGHCDLSCPGTCVPYPAVGEPCETSQRYPPCDPDTAFCKDGVCQARQPAGGPCEDMHWKECETGLVCVSDFYGAGVCGHFSEDGASCASDFECLGLLCVDGTCTSAVGAGERCDYGVTCPDGLMCRHDPADRSLPLRCLAPSGPGEPCVFDSECGDDLDCVFDLEANGTCGTLPAVGEACVYEQCAAGAECDSTQTCVAQDPPLKAGDLCGDWYGDCQWPLVCSIHAVCVEVGRIGASCEAPMECFSGACVDGVCAAGACPAP